MKRIVFLTPLLFLWSCITQIGYSSDPVGMIDVTGTYKANHSTLEKLDIFENYTWIRKYEVDSGKFVIDSGTWKLDTFDLDMYQIDFDSLEVRSSEWNRKLKDTNPFIQNPENMQKYVFKDYSGIIIILDMQERSIHYKKIKNDPY